MMDGKLSLELNSWFQPFTKMKASPESALSRLEPRKKSISMRNTNAFDDGFTVWLRRHQSMRTILEELKQHKIYPNRYSVTHNWRQEVALIKEASGLSPTSSLPSHSPCEP